MDGCTEELEQKLRNEKVMKSGICDAECTKAFAPEGTLGFEVGGWARINYLRSLAFLPLLHCTLHIEIHPNPHALHGCVGKK